MNLIVKQINYVSELSIKLFPLIYDNNFSYEIPIKSNKQKNAQPIMIFQTRNSYEDSNKFFKIKEFLPKFELYNDISSEWIN